MHYMTMARAPWWRHTGAVRTGHRAPSRQPCQRRFAAEHTWHAACSSVRGHSGNRPRPRPHPGAAAGLYGR
jgi:hypothetical protein